MFDMSSSQQQAALDAMGGESAVNIMHFILYLAGVAAIVWLLFVITHAWQAAGKHHQEPGEILMQIAFAVLLIALTGALIVY